MEELVDDPPLGSSNPSPYWPWWPNAPFIIVSLASPLAVMVVGKNTAAAPLDFFGEPPPGVVREKNGEKFS